MPKTLEDAADSGGHTWALDRGVSNRLYHQKPEMRYFLFQLLIQPEF
jgi:hypothetical protein